MPNRTSLTGSELFIVDNSGNDCYEVAICDIKFDLGWPSKTSPSLYGTWRNHGGVCTKLTI